MKSYLTSLKNSLSTEVIVNKTELTLQRWKLEQLQELCVGPCLRNQVYMTQREYMSIYDFKYLKRKLPTNVNHPKYKRDLSLVEFYLSVIEGGDQTIKQKMRLQIKPQEIVEYIKDLLSLLEANWNITEDELNRRIQKKARQMHKKSKKK